MDYQSFLKKKSQANDLFGFEPLWLPEFLYDFQRDLVSWSIRKGRGPGVGGGGRLKG